jgi:type II secretory pathway pseudopilin PulG
MTSLLHPRRLSHRALCAILAALMLVSPTPLLAQQPAAATSAGSALDASFILPDACAVIVCRPAQILSSPFAQLMPTEILQAAMMKQTGLDPLAAEQVVLSITPPMAGPPSFSLHSKFSGPVAFKSEVIPMPLNEEQIDGKRLLRNAADPTAPSFYFPDASTLVAANQPAITALTSASRAEPAGVAKTFIAADRGDDLMAMIDIATLRPLIGMGLAQAPIPPQFAEFAQIPNLVKTLALRVNLSHAAPSELVAIANSEADAAALEGLFTKAKQIMASQQAAQTQQLLASDDPIEQATGRYSERMAKHWDEQMQLQREGAKITLFRIDPSQGEAHQLVYVAVIGVLVALLLPAIQAARSAARRNSSMNNIKQILLGMLNYESARASYPAQANFSSEGKPLLSWRVHLLPFMEQQALYRQFHLDEPWDSDHNKALISQMPEVYLDPASKHTPPDGLTNYLAPSGPTALMNGSDKGTNIRAITDGTSNTIAVVQVSDERAVPWTKPEDWSFDAVAPVAGLGGLSPNVFLAGFCDGHVTAIAMTLDPTVLRALTTTAGGEVVNAP